MSARTRQDGGSRGGASAAPQSSAPELPEQRLAQGEGRAGHAAVR